MKPSGRRWLSGWIAALLLLIPSPAVAAPPGNDAFAARTTIAAVPFAETLSTAEATTEPGEPHPRCGEIGNTVWYQFTPGTDMVLGANTFGSNFDTLTAVWTGSQLDALTPVTCADYGSAVFRAAAGTTYLIQVGGWYGDSGELSFRLREVDAGFISGTVTETGTGRPLRRICVDTFDIDFGVYSFTTTDDAGRYEVPVRPGAYVVYFYDDCDDSSDHQGEWYDNVDSMRDATEVTVSASADATNIDAALDRACPGWGYASGTHIIGTDGPDVLVGGTDRDIICGLAGKDRIRGSEGNDILIGDEGRDKLIGGDDRDALYGVSGRDQLIGGKERDFLTGGNGRDLLRGGADRDLVLGDAGNDELSGGADDDHVVGQKGADELSGGSGHDKLRGNDGDDRMNGGPGKDECEGGDGQDVAARSCERTEEVP